MAYLEIRFLGGVSIKRNQENIEEKLSGKSIALISLLFSSPGEKVNKGKLCAYLWADSDEQAAKYNLRYNLWSMKQMIPPDKNGEEFIISSKEYCMVNRKFDYHADVVFLRTLRKDTDLTLSQYVEYKSAFGGDYLEGFYVKGCPEYSDLILMERMSFQNHYTFLLEKLFSLYESQDRHDSCIETLFELLAIDSYNDDYACRLMRAYLKTASISSAIKFYRGFEQKIRDNLNISPSAELKKIYSDIFEQKDGTGTEKTETQQHLEVTCFSMKEVNYSWISQFLSACVTSVPEHIIHKAPFVVIHDLSFIQPDLLSTWKRNELPPDHVPEVRIHQAMHRFLKHITCHYTISIKKDEITDPASLHFLIYLDLHPISGITVL